MKSSANGLPDSRTLNAALASLFARSADTQREVTIVERLRNDYESTFPSEIVTCRLSDGSELQVLCKYAGRQHERVREHKGGGTYEAQVYRTLLRSLPLPIPKLYGTYDEEERTWLVLEYVGRGGRDVQLKHMPPQLLRLAARWIAAFHRATEKEVSTPVVAFLYQPDLEYYVQWARRTLVFVQGLERDISWLPLLCRQFEELAPVLLTAPLTVTHGEFVPKNILVRDGNVYPVDWESAAIACGEIDLAMLTEGRWPPDAVRESEVEYRRVRWPQRPPADFLPKLSVARLYSHFRWLGEQPEKTRLKEHNWRFDSLQQLGQEMGLI